MLENSDEKNINTNRTAARQRPIVTVDGVAKITNLIYTNANKLIAEFLENGLLDQMDKCQRNRRFIYSSYLTLFSDEKLLEGASQNTLENRKEETRN